MTKKSPSQKSHNRNSVDLPTFLDHLHELRNRLFWTFGFIIVASACVFPLNSTIVGLLMAPLGDQSLYYLTPIGGFSFVVKICTYSGMLLALPVILFNTYRFFEPLMGKRRHSVAGFVFFSALLAAIGVVFAYIVSLPAALRFLTTLNVGQIQAMLTADAYLSFVMTYLLGAAILFQIPLILFIINSIRPLPPKRLLGMQRYVIVGAFIVAAIISPTPDILNQALLALPIVGMFQIGVACVWLQNLLAKRRQKPPTKIVQMPKPLPIPPPKHSAPPRRKQLIYGIVPSNPSAQPRLNQSLPKTSNLPRPPARLWQTQQNISTKKQVL